MSTDFGRSDMGAPSTGMALPGHWPAAGPGARGRAPGAGRQGPPTADPPCRLAPPPAQHGPARRRPMMSAAVKTRDEGSLPTLSIAGSRATLHLNRPAVMNRIQPEDIAEIMRLLAAVEANPDLRVLVIASTGKS